MGLRDEETDCRKCCVSDFKNDLCKKDFCEKYYREGSAEDFEKLLLHWIPCSERLPEKQGFYLVSVGAQYKTVRAYEYAPCEGYENNNLWKAEDGSYCFNWFVEAWMYLPDPYREGRTG